LRRPKSRVCFCRTQRIPSLVIPLR
jgi:hypothetical protein